MDAGLWPQRSVVDRLRGQLEREQRYHDSDMVMAKWREAVGPDPTLIDDKPKGLVTAPGSEWARLKVDQSAEKALGSGPALTRARKLQYIPAISHELSSTRAPHPTGESWTDQRFSSVTKDLTSTAEQEELEPRPRTEGRHRRAHTAGREQQTVENTSEGTEEDLVKGEVIPST